MSRGAYRKYMYKNTIFFQFSTKICEINGDQSNVADIHI